MVPEREASSGWLPGRLVAIDILRGVAVLAVLICHLPFSWETPHGPGSGAALNATALPGPLAELMGYGQYGVHLFLVISGFCIHMRWARTGGAGDASEFLPFWRRRLARLYPPYFVALLLSLAGLYFIFGVLHPPDSGGIAAKLGYSSTSLLVVDVILLVLLAQNLTHASDRVGNAPFWSLALEEQLYMLYFPLLWARRRLGWTGTIALCLAVTLAWRAVGFSLGAARPATWYDWGPSRWFEWVLGAIAVEAHVGMIKLPRWTSSLAVFVVALTLGVLCDPPSGLHLAIPGAEIVRDAFFGLAFFVLVNRARSWSAQSVGRLGVALATLGVWSYSIYLTHMPAVVAGKLVALRLGLGGGSVYAVLAVRAVAALAAGYVFHKLVEARFLHGSRRLRAANAPAAIAPRAPVAGA